MTRTADADPYDVDAAVLAAVRSAWADSQWDPDSGIPWAYHAASFDRLAEQLREQGRTQALLAQRPTQAQAEEVGMDLDEESAALRATGAVHRLEVSPNLNGTGWIVFVSSPLGAANLPQAQAELLGRLLLSGPNGDPHSTCVHGVATSDACATCAR